MMKLFFLVSCLLSLVSFGARAETMDDEFITMKEAIVQVMNKAAGKTQTFKIPIGKRVRFERLEITVKKCLGTNEFLPENFYAFLEINKAGREIFSGWMIRSEPGQNPLQDPDNDLWLVRCE